MNVAVRTLNGILRYAESSEAVRKTDLNRGDQLVVATENSVYSIVAGDDSIYSVCGGWFAREGPAPVKMAIHGCTWGGSVIQTSVLAAPGLRMEFGNGVVTSPIRRCLVIRAESPEAEAARIAEQDQRVLSDCGISWETVPVC
jgi:hypothetical protein